MIRIIISSMILYHKSNINLIQELIDIWKIKWKNQNINVKIIQIWTIQDMKKRWNIENINKSSRIKKKSKRDELIFKNIDKLETGNSKKIKLETQRPTP